MRSHCVGPTIPDSRDVLPAMLMIKPALLSLSQRNESALDVLNQPSYVTDRSMSGPVPLCRRNFGIPCSLRYTKGNHDEEAACCRIDRRVDYFVRSKSSGAWGKCGFGGGVGSHRSGTGRRGGGRVDWIYRRTRNRTFLGSSAFRIALKRPACNTSQRRNPGNCCQGNAAASCQTCRSGCWTIRTAGCQNARNRCLKNRTARSGTGIRSACASGFPSLVNIAHIHIFLWFLWRWFTPRRTLAGPEN